MIKWANDTVAKGGKSNKINGFKDAGLRSGIFFLDLLNGIRPGVVDYGMVTRGVSGECEFFFWIDRGLEREVDWLPLTLFIDLSCSEICWLLWMLRR